jgi:hypothetical protein
MLKSTVLPPGRFWPKLTIFSFIALIVLAGCPNGSTPDASGLVHAAAPSIDAQPTGGETYAQNLPAEALTVTASVGDGGALTYQWYRNGVNSTTGGTLITGATETSYTPSTTRTGTAYYYVIVTNTNSGVNGAKTAAAASATAKITVPPVSLAGLWDYLGSLPVNTGETPYTVTLAGPVTIDTSDTDANGVWATINRTVQGAGKYVILDLSDCTAAGNAIAGDWPLGNNHFNIIYANTFIKGVILPDTLQTIGYIAFYSCISLTGVTIPAGVTSIEMGAFFSCTGLTGVTIPAGVTSIEMGAFAGCTGLTSVAIPAGVTTIGDDAFADCAGLTGVTIPAGVTTIGDEAFSGCISLNNVTIPAGVTTIGMSAFNGCTSLSNVTIPDSVTSIGDDAFRNTPWYDSQEDGLVYINRVLYKYKGTMEANTTISDIRSGTVTIGGAFTQCTNLIGVAIPDSVTTIGDYAFYGTRLTSVTIPAGVTTIGYGAFYLCANLLTVIFAADSGITTEWDDNAFSVAGPGTGDRLWNAYHTLGGGPGTYTWDGSNWSKQP